MEGSPRADGGPETTPLPSRLRVVDSAVQPLGVETHWIGDPQDNPFSVLENEEPLGLVARIDWDVCPEPERVELVHPRVVAPFSTPRTGDVAQLRQRLGVEAPTFRAVLAGGFRAVHRTAALAPVEARHVSARQSCPVHAVPVNVAAARREAFN